MTAQPHSPIPREVPAAAPKVWTAGTLTYTTAGLVVLFAWLLWGDFAASLKDRTVGPTFQLLLKKYGATDMLVAIMMSSLPGIIGMVLTPVTSYLSDRHRGKWGRRIPFLIIPTPVIALSMIGLGFSPMLGLWLDKGLGSQSPGVNTCTTIFLGLFWILFDLAAAVAGAVFGGLISDVVPRHFFGRFMGAFRVLSLLVGMGFSYWLYGRLETAYFWIFIGMGTLYGGGFTLMCLKVKEGEYPPPPPVVQRGLEATVLAVKGYFKKCYRIPYYWWIYASNTFMWLALSPFNLYNVYYAKDMKMDLSVYGWYLTMTFAVSLVMAYPLGALADRFHPLRVVLVAELIYVVTTFTSGFMATTPATFGVAMLVHGVMAGTLMTGSASIYLRLFPKEGFTQFASASGLVGSIVGITVTPCMGMFLDYSHHVYRYTFFMGATLGLFALFTWSMVFRRYLQLGGRDGCYIPPE